MDDLVIRGIIRKAVYSKLSEVRVTERQFDNTLMHYVQGIPIISLLKSFDIIVNICCNVKERFKYAL